MPNQFHRLTLTNDGHNRGPQCDGGGVRQDLDDVYDLAESVVWLGAKKRTDLCHLGEGGTAHPCCHLRCVMFSENGFDHSTSSRSSQLPSPSTVRRVSMDEELD